MSQDSRASSAGFFLAGAVIGGAIGATVALLFAPQSGEETRKMIKEKAGEVSKDIKEMKDELEPKLKKAKADLSKKFAAK
jgi:gas vesicle protein